MGLTVVDAGVVIAILDPRDAHHAAALAAVGGVRREREGVVLLPASAYAEILVHPFRSGPAAVDIVRRFCSEQLRLEPLSPEIAERAALLRSRHTTLRLPDALVIATADALRADRLLTTDGRWSRFSELAVIVNPP